MERVPGDPDVTRCEPENCGSACCSPVMLPFTQAYARDFMNLDDRIRDWVLNDLTRIPNREGYTRAPWYRGAAMTRDAAGEDLAMPLFYECRHFDPVDNRCMDYANRPEVCSGYPWHGRAPHPAATIPPACSFNADVGREVRVVLR